MMRLYRANFSTNAERVALALGHKGLEVESRYIDYADRSEVQRVSGQDLIPVLVDGDKVVTDSTRIVVYVDELIPTHQPLFPNDDVRYAEMMFFIDWFNRVWKQAPNLIAAQLASEEPDHMLVIGAGREMAAALDGFETLLRGRDFLMSKELSAVDCAVFPFVKYALKREPADNEPFHRILDEYQQLDEYEHGRLRSWIKRVDALPRA
ncbi:MAG TPA: glutathione S-transferase family protein [Solirubrobacteraceae bacterium]|jgi:glutathione S-transferase|nr:glutathione S-transferase family protein [Solirubrobacteraceae bacterium]